MRYSDVRCGFEPASKLDLLVAAVPIAEAVGFPRLLFQLEFRVARISRACGSQSYEASHRFGKPVGLNIVLATLTAVLAGSRPQ